MQRGNSIFFSCRLFEQHRNQIYDHLESLVGAYQTRPYFLLQIVKKLTALADDDYAQQRVLLLLDELTEQE
jgi:hypothetical protein